MELNLRQRWPKSLVVRFRKGMVARSRTVPFPQSKPLVGDVLTSFVMFIVHPVVVMTIPSLQSCCVFLSCLQKQEDHDTIPKGVPSPHSSFSLFHQATLCGVSSSLVAENLLTFLSAPLLTSPSSLPLC